MMLKMKYFGALAGCVLATGSLYATSVTNTFNTTASADVGTWDGDLTRVASNYLFSAESLSGYPTGGSLALENYILTVEGAVSNVVSSGSSSLVDLMVQAARPDEELELPSEDAGSVHIAVAVDSNGCFNAYCKTNATLSGWCKIQSTPTGEDAWVRVSLLFNYTNSRCQIRINGEPVMSEYGYEKADGDATYGAWYPLATSGSGNNLVKVVGCTAIDEFVLNDGVGGYALAANAEVNDVPCAWLDAMGVAWNTTASYDESKKADGTTPMTVADKYKYCFDPFDGQGEAEFKVKSITTTDTQVTLALPTTVANGDRKVVVDYGTDKTFEDEEKTTTVDVTGLTALTIAVPEPGSVTYYRLRATDK